MAKNAKRLTSGGVSTSSTTDTEARGTSGISHQMWKEEAPFGEGGRPRSRIGPVPVSTVSDRDDVSINSSHPVASDAA